MLYNIQRHQRLGLFQKDNNNTKINNTLKNKNHMEPIQGTIENLTLLLDNGTLTISGEGKMKDIGYAVWPDSYIEGGFLERDDIWKRLKRGDITEDHRYSHCDDITTVIIQDGVTAIECKSFYNCINLTSITIPNSVTTIGNHAFFKCSSLTSITVGNGNTKYASEDGALFDKLKETIITCPEGKTGSYDIPNSVKTIVNGAFENCSSLNSITIVNSVKNSSSLKTIGEKAFRNCSNLTLINIPDSVTTIGNEAFVGCISLPSITIGNSVETIGNMAFARCSSLDSITIGKLVERIGQMAFERCPKLRTVVVLRETPPKIDTTSDGGTFRDIPSKTATLIVPKGCSGAYEKEKGWNVFNIKDTLTPAAE
jgi:hypothetical protein